MTSICSAAVAQEMPATAATACPATPAPLPAEFAGWTKPVPLTAAGKADDLSKAQVVPGRRADVTLLATADIAYPLPPEKPAGPASSGGILGFTVDKAGTYRVALGAGAWIDVVRDGKAVPSKGHGHGPDCSGIRKTVDFPLTPGSYVLEVSGSGTGLLPLMVSPLP